MQFFQLFAKQTLQALFGLKIEHPRQGYQSPQLNTLALFITAYPHGIILSERNLKRESKYCTTSFCGLLSETGIDCARRICLTP